MEQFDPNPSSIIDATLGRRCTLYSYPYSEKPPFAHEEMKLRAGVIDRIEDQNVLSNDAAKVLQPTERQRKTYETIKNVPVNVPKLASMLGVSEKTIKRDIADMQSAGCIKRIGSDKTGHWEIIYNVK